MLKAFALAALLLPAAAVAQSSPAELARRYVDLRPGLLADTQSAAPLDRDKLRAGLAQVAELAMKQAGAPATPEVRAEIEADIEKAVTEFASDPVVKDFSRRWAEHFVAGLSQRLAPEELAQLVRYYAEGEGAALARLQHTMFDEIGPAMAKIMVDRQAGRPGPDGRGLRTVPEAKVILGLFDEWVRIQRAMHDPGPGRDRSGLQGLSMMALLTFELHHERFAALWRALPDDYRRDIVERRASALARKEREAIQETAAGLRAATGVEALEKKLLEVMSAYDRKWKALRR